MNTLKNNVQLIGNIGLAPEIITLENGTKLAKFNLATKEFYRDGEGKMAISTEWHNLVAWGKNAELIEQYVKKGQKLTIEGKLCHRSYKTKEGKDRQRTEIYVQKFLMLMKSKMAA
jgi:single-strand DNA-binding protein